MSTDPLTRAEMLAAAEFTPDEFGVFTAGYIEGYAAGLAIGQWIGFGDGYDTHADEVSNWLAGTPQKLRTPTHVELQAARTADNEPCQRRCRECSKCIRYAEAWRNERRFGSPDFPGREQAEALTTTAPTVADAPSAAVTWDNYGQGAMARAEHWQDQLHRNAG